MFEKHYSDVLKYIFHNPCCTLLKIDKQLHLSNAIIISTVKELLEDRLIRNDEINGVKKEGFIITDKGLAYLEDKKFISLTKKIRDQKRLLRPRLSKRKLLLNAAKKAIDMLVFVWKYLATLSIAVIGAYLSIGDNFKNLIKVIKSFFYFLR